ncbi:hypothetical protein L6Q96_16020 [Candidatus Binatia bacterium]|nr:hypothetical protein [Candidatus Binatia bacterium]
MSGVRRVARYAGLTLGVLGLLTAGTAPAGAVPIDKEGSINVGVRSYANARIGTTDTHWSTFRYPSTGQVYWRNRTFPQSPAGHLRQNRYFLEAELDHNLADLVKRGVGPLSLLGLLPFKVSGLKYHLTYRGEWETLYDWGPKEYSTAEALKAPFPNGMFYNPATGAVIDVPFWRQRLRSLASQRNRLFQWYVEGSVGPLFARFGRQIISWGETDGFRLLDNINPLDSSFGGFLIPLDERRVPLDMLRVQYRLPRLGPVSEAFLELYGAIDDKVAFVPGTPAGSPWALPNLSEPSPNSQSFFIAPSQTFENIRGGGRLVFNYLDATFSLAHYYTFFDTPALQVFIKPGFPIANPTDSLSPQSAYPGGYSAQTFATAPHVQVTGASTTFAVEKLYSIVRSEAAFFNNEPRFSQFAIDPYMFGFYFPNPQTGKLEDCGGGRRCYPVRAQHFGAGVNPTGGRRTGSSFNYVLGLDVNQYIRWLNPNQTFFISTQFFWKHLFDVVPRTNLPGRIPLQGEVLPVPAAFTAVNNFQLRQFYATEPDYIHQPTDTFLHTLFIGTAYRGGTINPGLTMFYDWGGALVFQPQVVLTRDPFRFIMDYSILTAHTLKGGSGVSLLSDRSNIQFRLEYVI